MNKSIHEKFELGNIIVKSDSDVYPIQALTGDFVYLYLKNPRQIIKGSPDVTASQQIKYFKNIMEEYKQ